MILRGIDSLLEGIHSDTLISGKERLALDAFLNIHINDLGDYTGDVIFKERWADNLTHLGISAGAATEGHLIVLFAFFVDTQNTDVANVVMTAGIHAAGDIQFDITQVIQIVQVVELTLNLLGNGDGLGIGQGAEITTGTADDIG